MRPLSVVSPRRRARLEARSPSTVCVARWRNNQFAGTQVVAVPYTKRAPGVFYSSAPSLGQSTKLIERHSFRRSVLEHQSLVF